MRGPHVGAIRRFLPAPLMKEKDDGRLVLLIRASGNLGARLRRHLEGRSPLRLPDRNSAVFAADLAVQRSRPNLGASWRARAEAPLPARYGAGIIHSMLELWFTAAYAAALALEVLHLFRPMPAVRALALVAGAAALLGHTLFIAFSGRPLSLATAFGSLVFLAWILAVFYFYGSVHHRRVAWGLFVLPVVLGLMVLAEVFPADTGPRASAGSWEFFSLEGRQFWPGLHGALLLLAAVGVSVGFVASVMYLVQVRRLRAKTPPGQGMRLLSLERLEAMNRRALLLAFPLLTAGLLVGLGMMLQGQDTPSAWESIKIVSTLILWVVFAILLYLRHAAHARGTRLALWTIAAFVLLVCSLVAVHPFVGGTAP